MKSSPRKQRKYKFLKHPDIREPDKRGRDRNKELPHRQQFGAGCDRLACQQEPGSLHHITDRSHQWVIDHCTVGCR